MPGREDRQTMPLPSRIIRAMVASVRLSAAQIRSASFSRSASSMTSTGRPDAMAAMTSAMGAIRTP